MSCSPLSVSQTVIRQAWPEAATSEPLWLRATAHSSHGPLPGTTGKGIEWRNAPDGKSQIFKLPTSTSFPEGKVVDSRSRLAAAVASMRLSPLNERLRTVCWEPTKSLQKDNISSRFRGCCCTGAVPPPPPPEPQPDNVPSPIAVVAANISRRLKGRPLVVFSGISSGTPSMLFYSGDGTRKFGLRLVTI